MTDVETARAALEKWWGVPHSEHASLIEALVRAVVEERLAARTCFECDTPLIGPLCPKCWPLTSDSAGVPIAPRVAERADPVTGPRLPRREGRDGGEAMNVTDAMVEAGARAIANERAARKGAPPISNVLEFLKLSAPALHDGVIDDARACLTAALDGEPT